MGFSNTGLTRWRRHHWHHQAYRLCRLALGLARRSGGGGGASTPAWTVSLPESAPLAEGMTVCCDTRQSGSGRPRQDVCGPLQQMIMEVVRTASALGTVLVVERRHSEWVFAPPLATTNVDVMSAFWESVSSMRVTSTIAGDVLLPLLRCDALGIRHRLLPVGHTRPGRDVSVLLKEFEEDFGDGEEEEEEYAHEIALYVLELEVSCVSHFWKERSLVVTSGVARKARCMPGADISRMTAPDLIDKRLAGIQEIEGLWGFFHVWLGYNQETYWQAVNIFDRCFSKALSRGSADTITYDGCYLLARAALYIASKYTEVVIVDLATFAEARESRTPVHALRRCETQALRAVDFMVYGGCSPWFWLSRGGRRAREGEGGLAEAVENFLVQLAMRDYRFCGVRSSTVAAAAVYAMNEMGLVELESEKRRDRVLWSRCDEGEVTRGFEMLLEGLRGELSKDWLYEWHRKETRKAASEFAVRWAKIAS